MVSSADFGHIREQGNFEMHDVFTIHFEEPEFTIATCYNALIWSFRASGTVVRMQRSLPVHRDLARRYPNGFGVITIVGENVPLSMPEGTRETANAITAEFRTHYAAICDCIEMSGIKGAAIRSIMSGIRLFARPTCPAKIASNVQDACAWMVPYLVKSEPHVTLQAILDTASRVREPPASPTAPKARGVSSSSA